MPLTQVSSRLIEDTLRYVLGASGTNHYTFTGKGLTGAVNDPTLTLSRGHTYIFENRSGGHPFYIKTSIANGGTNDAYNTGVTNNGGGNGTEIVFTVPHDAPDTLYYQCSSHSSMNGQLSISGSVADGSITEAKLADDAVTADKLANSINTAIAANTAKDLTALSASNLTSGTVPDARISASSVTQHATSFDDNNIINDISALALKINAVQNASRYNTNSMSIETFEDSNGIASFTTMGRDATGEYISSIYNAVTNLSSGLTGGGGRNMGQDAVASGSGTPSATSYTGIDGVSRSYGKFERIGSADATPGYNGFAYGHIFGASDNFEVILAQRGEWQAAARIYNVSGNSMGAVGTFKSEPPQGSPSQTFSSYQSGFDYNGVYPTPAGSEVSNRTIFYRFFRENNTFQCSYTFSISDITFGSTELAALRASTDYISTFGSPTTINSQMIVIMGDAGSTDFLRIEMANTFAETVSATGTAISNVVTASSSTNKMGVVVTYIDAHGTTTLNTDLKLFLSADNGSNFTEVTLVAQPNFATGTKMALANDVTVTAGTQLKYKIQLANQAAGSKETRLTGVSLQF